MTDIVQNFRSMLRAIEGQPVQQQVFIVNTFVHTLSNTDRMRVLGSNAMFMFAQRHVQFFHEQVNPAAYERLMNLRRALNPRDFQWNGPRDL